MKYIIILSLGRCGGTLLQYGIKYNLNLTFFNEKNYNGCKNNEISFLVIQKTSELFSIPKENVIGYIYITRDIMYQAVSRYIVQLASNYEGHLLVGKSHSSYFNFKKNLENYYLTKQDLNNILEIYNDSIKRTILFKNHLKNKRVFNTTYNEIANNYENTLKSIFNFFNLGQVTDTKKYLVCTHSKVEDSFFEQFKTFLGKKE